MQLDKITKVAIETIRDCNGKCRICNYRGWTILNPLKMQYHTFYGIIDQITHLPKLEIVCPYNHNEPLLDGDIFGKIKYIREQLPSVRIELSTNGILLTKRNIDTYCALVDDRWISFHGVDELSYEYIMGIPWSNGLKLRKMIKDRPYVRFAISIGLTSRYTEEEVREFWSEYENVKLMIFWPRDRCGGIKPDEVKTFCNPPTPKFDCWRFGMFLVYDTYGNLVPCSNDLFSRHIYADSTMPLKEIMKRRDKFRSINREGEETICWRCEDTN